MSDPRRSEGPAVTSDVAARTGELFGRLFPAYDDAAFRASVELFAKRFAANAFPLDWFTGQAILDVGCGGGRYSIAAALLGAARVVGVDVSVESIADARRRASGLQQVAFHEASVDALPFPDATFDGVICSGVLHHVADPARAVAEIARVVRPGGMAYFLVYATEGLRWPMVQALRPIAAAIGLEAMEEAVADAGLAVNKRRAYLDDLFVPLIDFYSWPRLAAMLEGAGFARHERWTRGRLDHEENLEAYRRDIEGFGTLFAAGARGERPALRARQGWFRTGMGIVAAVAAAVRHVQAEVVDGRLAEDEAMRLVVGQGHHRVVAWKTGLPSPRAQGA